MLRWKGRGCCSEIVSAADDGGIKARVKPAAGAFDEGGGDALRGPRSARLSIHDDGDQLECTPRSRISDVDIMSKRVAGDADEIPKLILPVGRHQLPAIRLLNQWPVLSHPKEFDEKVAVRGQRIGGRQHSTRWREG